MRAVVGDEDLLTVVNDNTVGKFQMFGAAKFIENVAHLIEDDDAHHFAFDNNDATLGINAHASRMLKDVGAKLPHKLPVPGCKSAPDGWESVQ